ncbi:MAG: hypothetical protein KA248_12205 [Kiritimatiellae bacterium]|nr:hypothetical protein [Kiritimatiellia bacterium]
MSGRVIQPVLAIALGGILLLVSWIVPGAWQARRRRAQEHTRSGALVLRQAAYRFYSDYGVWPVSRKEHAGDAHFGGGRRNAEVLNALRALDGPGNGDHEVNPHRTVYFDPPPAAPGRPGLDAWGNFVDAWGVPYHIVVDVNLNGVCEAEDTIHGGQIGAGILVWSGGLDRRPNTPDDILSWKP